MERGKTEEFRIGNYVFDKEDRSDDTFYEVALIKSDKYMEWSGDSDDYNISAIAHSTMYDIVPLGIPITEDRLLKFGFEFNGNSWQGEFDGGCREWQFVNGVFDSYQDYGDDSFSWDKKAEIKYFHQLQNFIFIKTGEELKYKP